MIVTVLLLFSVISLFRLMPTEELELIKTVTVNDTEESSFSVNELILRNNSELPDTVILRLAGEIPTDGAYHLYIFDGASEDVGKIVAHGIRVNDGKALVFAVPESASGDTIRITSDRDITSTEVSLMRATGDSVVLKFNFAALALLLLLSVALIFAERWTKYFAWIKETVINELNTLSELMRINRTHAILRYAATGTTLVFAVTVTLLLCLSHYSKASIISVFILASIALALQLCSRILSKQSSSPAELYITAALIFGFMICYTAPVSTHIVWDDEIHFRYAYANAVPYSDDFSLALHKLFSRNYKVVEFISSPSNFVNDMVSESKIIFGGSYPRSFWYAAMSYFPFTSSILFSNFLGNDIITLMTLSRIAGMVAYAFITYSGIKKLKSGAYVFASICLLPCTLYLACTIGYDLWLTAWFVYAFAYIISVFQDPERKFTAVDILKILAALFLGCASKAVYFFMMLPILFIPKKKFSNAHLSRWSRILTVVVMALIVCLIFTAGVHSDSRGGSNVSATAQLEYVLTHPFNYAFTLLKHMIYYCSPVPFVGYSSVFGFLNGYKQNPHIVFGIISLAILTFATLTDHREDLIYTDKDSRRFRFITIAISAMQVMAICTVMYLCYTNVGANFINGCQFRYLFPIFIPFCFFITPKRFRVKLNRTVLDLIIFGGLSANLISGYLVSYVYKLMV